MDVIGAYVRRLPALDDRWTPRTCSRAELEDGLRAGGVAGEATHPLDNVRGNILMLMDGDLDKLFGLSGLPGSFTFLDILAMVGEGAGVRIDPEARFGPVQIEAAAILDACFAMGDRLVKAATDQQSVILATGHPIGLALHYHALDRLLADRGATVVAAADEERWRDPQLPHEWRIRHRGGVGMLTDEREPRHTHRPDAMERMLQDVRPDLVLADHGFAGAAIEASVETLSIADVNDPALIVARGQGRTEHVLVMDDHVAPDAYWPCFQAIASRF